MLGTTESSLGIQRKTPDSETNEPRLPTPTNEYLDQTPCSADSRRKLPGLEAASFSNIVSGVSVPEKSVETIGMTLYELASSRTCSRLSISAVSVLKI